jgi:hypothetical protein
MKETIKISKDIEVPYSKVDAAVRKELRKLHRQLSNANDKADAWKLKCEEERAEVKRMNEFYQQARSFVLALEVLKEGIDEEAQQRYTQTLLTLNNE